MHSKVVTLLSALLLLSSTTAAFDPIPEPAAFAPNITHTLPSFTCTLFTYTLPANHNAQFRISASRGKTSINLSLQRPQACDATTPNTFPLLENLNGVDQIYQTRNITDECFTKDTPVWIHVLTGQWEDFTNRNVRVEDIVQGRGDGCVELEQVVKKEEASPTDPNGNAQPTSTWGLLPPPPGAVVRENAAGRVRLNGITFGFLGATLLLPLW
ncbi:hypothetical protein BC832DRAFT_540463 [Gaertneriomyces semiglobifer]|nr:hypothetical protein BC832DRAFT_540463 [Gaertneriomyces semiglobifer]